jgi:hypothetical protein
MAAKLTGLTHKIAMQLHLVAGSFTNCSSRSRRPVRKLLDTLSSSDPLIPFRIPTLWALIALNCVWTVCNWKSSLVVLFNALLSRMLTWRTCELFRWEHNGSIHHATLQIVCVLLKVSCMFMFGSYQRKRKRILRRQEVWFIEYNRLMIRLDTSDDVVNTPTTCGNKTWEF